MLWKSEIVKCFATKRGKYRDEILSLSHSVSRSISSQFPHILSISSQFPHSLSISSFSFHFLIICTFPHPLSISSFSVNFLTLFPFPHFLYISSFSVYFLILSPFPLNFLIFSPFPLHFLILSPFPRSLAARLQQVVQPWVCIVTLVTFVWLFTTVCLHVPSNYLHWGDWVGIECGSNDALHPFWGLFLGLQPSRSAARPRPQETCIQRGYIVTLTAFICLFPSVCFQMCLQIACLGRCLVTLIAFVGNFYDFLLAQSGAGIFFKVVIFNWLSSIYEVGQWNLACQLNIWATFHWFWAIFQWLWAKIGVCQKPFGVGHF